MSNPRKLMPPLLPSKGREKAKTFDFIRNVTSTSRAAPPNQAKPKTDSHRASFSNKPTQGTGSSLSAIDPRSTASMKPSKATAHSLPSPSRIMGPPPPRRVVASPPAQRSSKATARAKQPSKSAPPPQDRTYLREKASSKQLSRDTARPPRPVRPSHETATNKPSKSATPRPLTFDPNMFMAGKLAHEYLTNGTLFGQPYVPTEADFSLAPLSSSSADVGPRKEPSKCDVHKEKEKGRGKGKAIETEPKPNLKSSGPKQQSASNVRYANVSKKLKNRGMHIPGIVNPSELADYLDRHPEIE